MKAIRTKTMKGEKNNIVEESSDMHTTNSQSPPICGELPSKNRGEDSEVRRRSTWKIRLLERYKDYALLTSVLNVIESMTLMKVMNMKSREKNRGRI